MGRSIIKKIEDIFKYNKEKYKEFVKRYGFTLPKFLFRAGYYSLLSRDNYAIEESLVFDRLSRFKDFTEDEILYFLENVNINSQILNSSNYKFWCNPKIVNTFIKDYSLYNRSDIDEICELDMVDIYIRFQGVFSYDEFVKLIKTFDNNKALLNKLSKEDVISSYFPNLISLHKADLPNKRKIIELYNKNLEFRRKYDYYEENNRTMLFMVLNIYTDLSDVKKVINCLDILNYLPEMYFSYKDLQPSIEIVLNKMLEDEKYYNLMLRFKQEKIEFRDDYLSIENAKSLFQDKTQLCNFFKLHLYKCENIEQLKTLFYIIFPEYKFIERLDRKNINDEFIEKLYDLCIRVKKETNLDVCKKFLSEKLEEIDLLDGREKATKFIAELEVKKLFDKTFDQERMKKLKCETKHIGNKDVPIYFLEDIPFEALVHVINRENRYMMQTLNLKNKPELWGSRNIGPKLLSLSMVGNNHRNMFETSLIDFDLNTLVIGFDPVPSEIVSVVSPQDAGTRIDSQEVRYDLSNIVIRVDQLKNGMNFSEHYNEVAVSRFFDDGRPVIPSYVLVRKQDIDNLGPNSPQVLWANHFGIPIIAIDFQKYVDKASQNFYDALNELENLDERERILRLPEVMMKFPYMYEGSRLRIGDYSLALRIYNILKLYETHRNIDEAKAICSINIPNSNNENLTIFDFLILALDGNWIDINITKELMKAKANLPLLMRTIRYDIKSMEEEHKNDIRKKM